jgi:hypothetical protein
MVPGRLESSAAVDLRHNREEKQEMRVQVAVRVPRAHWQSDWRRRWERERLSTGTSERRLVALQDVRCDSMTTATSSLFLLDDANTPVLLLTPTGNDFAYH